MNHEQDFVKQERAEHSRQLAVALFPHEEWIQKEPKIWVAKSRLRNTPKEREKLAREIEQTRFLTGPESTVYFLPELEDDENLGKLSADTVIDGEIVEIKSVRGTRVTLGTEFRKGYRQGAYLCGIVPEIEAHSVFIRLFSDLSPGSVKAKIAGELKNRTDKGRFICYFEASGTLFSWTYDELRGMISEQKITPPGISTQTGERVDE